MREYNYYDSLLDRIYSRIKEEVYILQEKTGETDITIFLSVDLFMRLAAGMDMLRIKDIDSFKLFGCNVERYADSGLSFYVTTAKKIRYS
jgi:hypothetical protein